MRKIYLAMALSLVCAMGLHADDELYGVKEGNHLIKLYYDNERAIRGGTKEWKTEFKDEAMIVSLDESIKDITNIDVTTFISFKDFTSLVYIEHLDYYHFSGGMTDMFKNCESLKWVDLSSFDFSNMLSGGIAEGVFKNCSSLQSIYCDVDWSGDNIRFKDDMFTGCESLEGGEGTVFDASKVKDEYARPDGGESSPGYFTPTSKRVVCGLITSCEFKGFNQSALKPGVEWTGDLAYSILSGIEPINAHSVYSVGYGALRRFDENEGMYVEVEYGTVLEEGPYNFEIAIYTSNPACDHGQRFPLPSYEGPVSITVDGQEWTQGYVNVSDVYSVCNAEFEFTVSKEGVENIRSSAAKSQKMVRNGQLLIERNGKTFNAVGAEVK